MRGIIIRFVITSIICILFSVSFSFDIPILTFLLLVCLLFAIPWMCFSRTFDTVPIIKTKRTEDKICH